VAGKNEQSKNKDKQLSITNMCRLTKYMDEHVLLDIVFTSPTSHKYKLSQVMVHSHFTRKDLLHVHVILGS